MFALLCLGMRAFGQIKFVQEAEGINSGTINTSMAVTFASPTTSGDLIVAYVAPATNQPGSISVTDSDGNAYTAATSTMSASQCPIAQQFFYASNIVGGNDTITTTITNPDGLALVILEYSGIAISPLDSQAGTSQMGCPWSNSPSSDVLMTNGNDLVVSGAVLTSANTMLAPGSGYTLRTDAFHGFAVEDEVLSAAGTYTGTFSSSGPANWVAAAISFKPSGILCGQLDDGLTHVPPSYVCTGANCGPNPFPPPPVGQSYVDPQYGCRVMRLADGIAQFGVPAHHYYGTFASFNADDSKVMLFLDNGGKVIVDLHGNVIVPLGNMPSSNTSVYLWDPANPAVFYYSNGNQFLKGTITNNAVSSTALHTFDGYSNCAIPDQEDLSDDGSKLWLVCTPIGGSTSQNVAVLYNLLSDTVVSNSLVIGAKESGWHKIQIFPSGKMLLTGELCNGTQCIYNTDGTLYWQPPFGYSSHSEVGSDLQGREVMISSASGIASLNACGSEMWSSLTVIDINAKAPVNCLIGGPPNPKLPPWEISYRDSGNNSSGKWVLLSMFDQSACPDYSCFYPQDLAANWQSLWRPYDEELVLVKIDGSQVQRLGYSWSRSAENYWAVPRASISRDGKYLIFDSNFNISNTGFPQYSDVYLMQIQ
jgi:hypothetical protein